MPRTVGPGTKPAHAADLGVEPRVAVGDDVEAGEFLIAKVGRDRVGVLLAEARIAIASHELARPRFSVYQAGRGNEPVSWSAASILSWR